MLNLTVSGCRVSSYWKKNKKIFYVFYHCPAIVADVEENARISTIFPKLSQILKEGDARVSTCFPKLSQMLKKRRVFQHIFRILTDGEDTRV